MFVDTDLLTEEELETLIDCYDLDPVTLKPIWK